MLSKSLFLAFLSWKIESSAVTVLRVFLRRLMTFAASCLDCLRVYPLNDDDALESCSSLTDLKRIL